MRRLACLALAPLVAGCVWALEPLQLAVSGPPLHLQLAETPRPLQPGERVGLVLLGSETPGQELRDCLLKGLKAGLPATSSPVLPDPGIAPRLAALAEAASPGAALPPEAGGFGLDWLVAVRDRSEVSPEEEVSEGFGGQGAIGWMQGTDQRIRLLLEAQVLDLRAQRHWGVLTAEVETRRRSGMAAGIFGGAGAAAPFIMPVLILPAGSSPLAICEATGKAIGAALVNPSAEPGTPAPTP